MYLYKYETDSISARKSAHEFSSEEEAAKYLIDNFKSVFFKAPTFIEDYYFNFTHKTEL